MQLDVKPNVGALHDKEEGRSFISRVAKRSGKIFIEEYPTIETPRESGRKAKLHAQTTKMQSTPYMNTKTQKLTRPNGQQPQQGRAETPWGGVSFVIGINQTDHPTSSERLCTWIRNTTGK